GDRERQDDGRVVRDPQLPHPCRVTCPGGSHLSTRTLARTVWHRLAFAGAARRITARGAPGTRARWSAPREPGSRRSGARRRKITLRRAAASILAALAVLAAVAARAPPQGNPTPLRASVPPVARSGCRRGSSTSPGRP